MSEMPLCSYCRGSGEALYNVAMTPHDPHYQLEPCRNCLGTGFERRNKKARLSEEEVKTAMSCAIETMREYHSSKKKLT